MVEVEDQGPAQAPATGLNLEGNWGSKAIWYLVP